MTLKTTALDTSHELQVFRLGQGIKLGTHNTVTSPYEKLLGTVSSLLAIPCSVYLETADGVIQTLNERNVEFCGLDSVQHAIGRRYFDLLPRKTIDMLRYNDHFIMKNGIAKTFEEDIFQSDGNIQKAITIRAPWYSDTNKVVGLFGMTILIGKDGLVESLSEIANMGFLTHPLRRIDNINNKIPALPRQQLACARLLLSGMTNKQIASKLQLSPRTVESYINSLKSKFLCCNKTELITKLLHHFTYADTLQ